MTDTLTRTIPAWRRCHDRAMRSAASTIIFTALEGLELIKERRQCPEGGWMQWAEDNYPQSYESCRMRVNLGEALEFRLRTEAHSNLFATDNVQWFLGLAESDAELTHEEEALALGILQSIAPAGTVKQLFAECGVIKLPPKPEPKPPKNTEPRPPRPPVPMHVRVGRTWEKFPREEKLAFIHAHLPEIEELIDAARDPDPLQLEATK